MHILCVASYNHESGMETGRGQRKEGRRLREDSEWNETISFGQVLEQGTEG